MDYVVYLMASGKNGTLYAGVTNDLVRRVYEHKNAFVESFTSRYAVDQLVWFETTPSIEAAIHREKQLKNWKRVEGGDDRKIQPEVAGSVRNAALRVHVMRGISADSLLF